MRIFIRRFLFFALQAVLLVSALFAFVNVKSKAQLKSYALEQGIHKLAIGDSRMQRALDDKLIAGSKNVARESESFIYSYYKLKGLLAGNPAVDTVFLGISYHSFSQYYDTYIYLPEIASRYFSLLPFNEQVRILNKADNPISIVMKSIAVGFQNLLSAPPYSYIGAFDDHETEITMRAKSVKKRINLQYYDEGALRELSLLNLEYYRKIKQLCAEEKIQLILINTPMHPEYTRQVPAKFKEAFFDATKDEKSHVIDFEELVFMDDDFFPDGDHVSAAGGKKASEYIRQKLEDN